MHLAFLNPQGNFDRADSYWTEHPDFGGQLVYVKQVALALGAAGHRVDILTRLIVDADWPEFAHPEDRYEDAPSVRIIRLPAGDTDGFLRKEDLWPFLVRDWVPNILRFYDGKLPNAFTGHYGDGGVAGVLLRRTTGAPFTFTAHSLGAQKLDKLGAGPDNLATLDAQYHFRYRLAAERLAMNHAGVIITSTVGERLEQYGHRAYEGAVDVADDSRFAVVPPGVDLSVFGADTTAPDEGTVRQVVDHRLARDIAPDRLHLPAVVASSRLDPKKNHLDLVRAFAVSGPLREAANLVIITGSLDDPLRSDEGAGETERQVLAGVRSTVEEGGLSGKVSAFSIRGQLSLAAAYRYLAARRSVFALTALHEPFGLAPLEAAAAGLPVVATKNGGPSESLRDDSTEYGVLVDPEDPREIAAGLQRALGSEWEDFARLGRQRVLDRYTWDRSAAGYVEAIEQAVTSPDRTLLPIDPFFQNPERLLGIERLEAYFPG